MAYLLEKKSSALHIPKKKRRITMATFLLSSVRSFEGGHGLCHHLLEKRSPKKEGVMTMVIFLVSSVEMTVVMAYLLEKRRFALPLPREEGRMAMATFLLSSVKSREGGQGLCRHLLEERGTGLLVLRGKGVWPWPSSSLP